MTHLVLLLGHVSWIHKLVQQERRRNNGKVVTRSIAVPIAVVLQLTVLEGVMNVDC
jgi:hypothetical protein